MNFYTSTQQLYVEIEQKFSWTHFISIHSSVANLIYKELDENDWWKVQLAHEIIDMKEDISVAPVGWEKDDLNFILTTICTD